MQSVRVLPVLIALPPALGVGYSHWDPAAREYDLRGQMPTICADNGVVVTHDEIVGLIAPR